MGRSVVMRVKQPRPEAISGLNWNLNDGDANSDVAFRFTGSNVVPRYPRTEIRRVIHRAQGSGFYTTCFRTSYVSGSFVADGAYEGFHPYPYGGTTHWEISVNGTDTPAINSGLDANGNSTALEFNREYIQGIRVSRPGGTNIFMEYFYDLPNLNKLITYTLPNGNVTADGTVQHVFGASPWTEFSGANNETHCGKFRGNMIFNSLLSDSNMLAAGACNSNAEVLALSLPLWYLNMNPKVADILDKSGNGHHPTWINAFRPQDY